MTTLAKVTSLTRRFLKWGAIIFGGIILLLILSGLGKNLKNRFFPPPPPAPTVAFGKLPPLQFPGNLTNQKLEFTLDTISGALPTLPSQISIYKLVKNEPSLLSLQKAKRRVGQVGFTTDETQLSSLVYQWKNPQNSSLIKLNIVTNDFDLASDFYSQPEVLAAENLPNPEQAKEIAKNFLGDLGLFPSSLGMEDFKTTLFSIQDKKIIPSDSFSNAQIIRVDLFQKPINNFPFVYPQKNSSLINFLVAGNSNRERPIVEAHYFSREADLNNSSTYPLKTISAAFDELKNGTSKQVYIASINNQNITSISIKNVYLGYYLDRQSQDFLSPVFVFEGSNGFLAYVLAISPEWINEPSQ